MLRRLIAVSIVALSFQYPLTSFAAPKKAKAASRSAKTRSARPARVTREPASAISTSRATTMVPLTKDATKAFSFGFFNFSSAAMSQVHRAAATVHGYNYFMLDYNLSKSRRISVRPVFSFDTAGNNNRDDYQDWSLKFVDDSFISFIDKDVYDFADGTRVGGEMRVYAPTGRYSQNQGTIARLRPKIEAAKRLSRGFEVVALVEPDYYIQSRTGFVDDRGKVRGNRNYGYESEVALRYAINRAFGTAVAAGHQQMWTHSVDVHGVPSGRNEYVTLEASGSVFAGPVFLVAGVTQKHDVARPSRKLTAFHSDETEYFLLNSWRF